MPSNINFKFCETPLVVDLDGTLILTDMLHESAVKLFKKSPFQVLNLFFILIWKGKSKLKQWLSRRVSFDPSLLPYNVNFIKWLEEQKKSGRMIILCTASDISLAASISGYLNIFDDYMGSDGLVNLQGHYKAQVLIDRFGAKGYDYAGNSMPDKEVWRHGRRAIIVNATENLIRDVSNFAIVEKVFVRENLNIKTWANALRIHQWLKNLLLFVPLLAAHSIFNAADWLILFLAFMSFGFCASAVYIFNDILDLESDRSHPRKFKRPFACGALPIYKGFLLGVFLLITGCIIGDYVGSKFFDYLLIYLILTCFYSFKIKQIALIDCLALAILYTLRLMAGAAAIDGAMSYWLLSFSVFLFLSLAFIKRFAELQVQLSNGKHHAHGRGYFTDDAPLIQMLGVASGFMSVLVLALYLNSPEVQRLYAHPEWVWGTVPVMVFWVSWLWLCAHRGEMHDDPLIFAVKDQFSLVAGVFFAAFILLGAIAW